jgi:hypothetical protein
MRGVGRCVQTFCPKAEGKRTVGSPRSCRKKHIKTDLTGMDFEIVHSNFLLRNGKWRDIYEQDNELIIKG